MSDAPVKIAIIGPESTGKSTLAQQLAAHYHTVWVPEYSRYYCRYLSSKPTLQDELNMFYGQIALEESLIHLVRPGGMLICDVTILTVKIWCEELFGFCPDVVLEEIRNRCYDFYLLTYIDMPWEDDPMRDFPDRREYFFNRYKKELEDLNAGYRIIKGQGNARTRAAIQAVDDFYSSGFSRATSPTSET